MFIALSIVLALVLAGCASRPLNAPPVVDWSDGAAARPAATPATTQQLYTVKRDDTLASIAQRFNVAPADLIAWNGLGSNPRPQPNQVLRVSPPVPVASAADSAPPVAVAQPIGTETVEQRPLGPQTPGPAASPQPSNAPLKTGPLGVKRPYSDAAFAELSKPDGDAPAMPVVPATAPASASTAVSWSWPAAGKPTTTFGEGRKGIDIAGKDGDAIIAAADGKVTFAGAGVRGYGNFVIVQHTPELLSVYAHNRTNLVKEGAAVTKGQKIAEMGNTEADSVKVHFEIRNDSKPVDPLKYLPAR